MRWAIGVIAGLIVLLVVAFVAVPQLGGPRPGRIADRTTDAECRAAVRSQERQPTEASAGWIWSSNAYGWGCRYRYADGSTGEMIEYRGSPKP